ncbi:MAG: divalent metal cation transporter, partial [Planctomycetota bacterium]
MASDTRGTSPNTGDDAPEPWSLKTPPLSLRALGGIGAGALVASFFIGTADITIATEMGARFGFSMWWTYFVLGAAGWAMMDMSVRYFLRFGRTPVALFKEVHPLLSFYLLATIVVTTTVGAYSQWNACALVLSGFFPGLPTEVGGALSALTAAVVLASGAYRRIEMLFVVGLFALVGLFGLAALASEVDWEQAASGLIPSGPREPEDRWYGLLQSNAGSLINAWLILVYPYTIIEKGWFGPKIEKQTQVLKRAR